MNCQFSCKVSGFLTAVHERNTACLLSDESVLGTTADTKMRPQGAYNLTGVIRNHHYLLNSYLYARHYTCF